MRFDKYRSEYERACGNKKRAKQGAKINIGGRKEGKITSTKHTVQSRHFWFKDLPKQAVNKGQEHEPAQ